MSFYVLGLAHVEVDSESKLEQAIDYFKAALEIRKGWEVYVWRGIVYYVLDKKDLALRDFKEAISLNSENATIYNNRGIVYANQKKYKEAIDDYT